MLATVHIEGLAAGGDGVARHEGLVVFVPRTAVGDVARVSLDVRGRFARGRLRELLEPSPERVEPPCVHFSFDECGGCQWQHLHIDAQRRAKALIVRDAFARIAGVELRLPQVIGDARTLGYRRTLRFTVRGTGRARVGGFHAATDPDVIVPIERCLLAHPELQRAWDGVRSRLAELPQWNGAPEPSPRRAAPRGRARPDRSARTVQVTLRRLGDGAVALVVAGGDRWPSASIAAVAESVPGCRGVWWSAEGGTPRVVWTDGTTDARAADEAAGTMAAESARDDELAVAASFTQVNADLADELHAYVRARVLELRPRTVVDGYAGAGRLAAALDAAGVTVTAIERDPRASRATAARLGPASRALTGTVEARLGEALPADVVVLNPPRAGCHEEVCAVLATPAAASGTTRIVYVSCDPATLARDVRRLAGWTVESLTCFDLFPQTAHVESVCVLRPEAA